MAFCPNCGTQIEDNATVCSKCGTPVENIAPAQGTAQEAVEPAAAAPEPVTESAPTPEPVAEPVPEPAPQPAPEPIPAPMPGPAPNQGANGANYQNTYQNAYQNPYPDYSAYQAAPMPAVDIYDHTAEFDPQDISDNKCIALLCYLLGAIGIVMAALVSRDSAYVGFHIRQAIKLTIAGTLVAICAAVLCFTVIVPIAAGVCTVIIFVLRVIAVFQIFGGKAVEPPIVRNLGFLR